MRLLALDIGTKRVGVAFCDTSIGIVFAREVIVVKNERDIINNVKEIVAKDRIDKVIVGLPLNFNSTRSHIQSYVENIAAKIKKEVGIDVELFDERFTTKIATQIGSKNIDSISAKILLEDYINLMKNKRLMENNF